MFLNTSLDGDITTPDHRVISINIVKNNIWIIDSHKNWNVSLYKDPIKIKELKALLNIGVKASKELDLFNWTFFNWTFLIIVFSFDFMIVLL